jgi:hypothetical protein
MAILMTAGGRGAASKEFLPSKCSRKNPRRNGWQDRSSNQCLKTKLVRKTPPNHHSKNSQNQIRSNRKLIKLLPKKKNLFKLKKL